MPLFRRARFQIAFVAVAVLVAAACGSSSAPNAGPPLHVVTLSPSRLAGDTMRITVLLSGIPGTGGKPIATDGEFDFRTKHAVMTLSALGRKFDEIEDAGVLYVRIPGLASEKPGKTWVRFDGASLARLTGGDTGAVARLKTLTW